MSLRDALTAGWKESNKGTTITEATSVETEVAEANGNQGEF